VGGAALVISSAVGVQFANSSSQWESKAQEAEETIKQCCPIGSQDTLTKFTPLTVKANLISHLRVKHLIPLLHWKHKKIETRRDFYFRPKPVYTCQKKPNPSG
jgi:hypothetical protein